jgi:cytochrome P450
MPSDHPVSAAALLDPAVDHAERLREMAERRGRCPVDHLAEHAADHVAGGLTGEEGDRWYLASFDSVSTALAAVGSLSGGIGAGDSPEDLRGFNGLPEPRHGQVRRIVNGLIAGHRARYAEPFVGDLARRLLADVTREAAAAGPDGVDVMTSFVDHVPCATIAWLLGWPIDNPVQLYHWADELCTRAMEMRPGTTLSMIDLCPPFAAYVRERIEARVAAPEDEWPDDGLSHLLRAEIDGARMTPAYVGTQIIFLLGSGSETTRSLIGGLLHELASDPALYRRLRDDRELVPAAVEEGLRFVTPTQFMVRRCVTDVDFGGRRIAAGDDVVIGLASANRDESVFDRPDTYDIDRPNARSHVTFGGGPHVCPGATLARIEARVSVNAFLDAFEAAAVVPDGCVPMRNAMFNGPKYLRLHLTPAPGTSPAS